MVVGVNRRPREVSGITEDGRTNTDLFSQWVPRCVDPVRNKHQNQSNEEPLVG